MEQPKPNPGSQEAIDQGCSCPVLDNHYGKGVPGQGFWMTADCPVHGVAQSPAEVVSCKHESAIGAFDFNDNREYLQCMDCGYEWEEIIND